MCISFTLFAFAALQVALLLLPLVTLELQRKSWVTTNLMVKSSRRELLHGKVFNILLRSGLLLPCSVHHQIRASWASCHITQPGASDRGKGRNGGAGTAHTGDFNAYTSSVTPSRLFSPFVLPVFHRISEWQLQATTMLGKIFVGGLPRHLTEDELRTYFQSFGDVVDAVILYDPATKNSRGFGFVTFTEEQTGCPPPPPLVNRIILSASPCNFW